MASKAKQTGQSVTRRTACGLLVGALAASMLPRQGWSANGAHSLSFYHLHTEEALHITYRVDGAYVRAALDEINYVLRDHYSGEITQIDVGLLDLLHAVRLRLGTEQPFEVISAYRSHATNEWLRQRGRKVGKKSLHRKGKAIDVRLPHTELRDLRNVARALRKGGVGYYPASQFVHIDTGRVRYW